MADPQTPEEIEAERVRLEKEVADKAAAEKKAARQAAKQAAKDAPVEDEYNAATRLRAFEDEVFGPDAVRIGGKIERGHGSPFSKMTDEQRRQYEALEKLAAAEQKLGDAHAALLQAEEDHQAALAACEPRPDPEAEATKAKADASAAG